jgi:hypothetical protein
VAGERLAAELDGAELLGFGEIVMERSGGVRASVKEWVY